MQNIDIAFLKKEIKSGVNAQVPLFFAIFFSVVIIVMLAGSAKAPHDVRVATWGISAGLWIVCVMICGIKPLLNHKRTSNELCPENIKIKTCAAVEKYISNDDHWVAFEGEENDRRVTNQFFYREFVPGRVFHIVERVQYRNGRETKKLIGIYPADRYTIDEELRGSCK